MLFYVRYFCKKATFLCKTAVFLQKYIFVKKLIFLCIKNMFFLQKTFLYQSCFLCKKADFCKSCLICNIVLIYTHINRQLLGFYFCCTVVFVRFSDYTLSHIPRWSRSRSSVTVRGAASSKISVP